ncbi:MAG: ATP-binding protein [Actinobacteria bacterium]|nr:ATP-binding protein [Actinomycetota bacterium]
MDALRNPYTPGAGYPPPALTGRDPELEQFALLLGRLELGRPEQSLLITGLRGVGKTVLLDAFEGIAIERGWFATSTEITSETRLAKVIATMTREALFDLRRMERVRERARRALSILKAFTLITGVGIDIRLELDVEEGTADSGDLGRDLGDLLVEVGSIARDAGCGVLFLLDEVQFLERADFEALIAGMHRSSRRQLPITVVGAGLPSLPRLAGEAKSYAERLFTFPEIGALSDPAARLALVEPAAEEGVTYTDDGLDLILRHSGRYPYFLQQYGKHAWLTGADNLIDERAVERAHQLVVSVLDTDFFHVRFERATPAEQRYLAALAALGDGPQRSGGVTRQLGYVSTTETGPIRDTLIKKGLIYSPRHGLVEFTVPLFADFMRRQHPPAELALEP